MVEIKKIAKDFRKKWNDFVRENNGTIFHSWEWSQVLKESYGYEPVYLGAFDGDKLVGILSGVLWGRIGGNRLTSMPLADFSGPLGPLKIQKKLLEKFKTINKNSQVYTTDPLSSETPFCHFILDVKKSYEAILKNDIHQKTRNMINKAEREGINVKKVDIKQINQYYPLYFKTLLKLNSLPLSKKLFQKMGGLFGEHIKIFLGFYNNKVVASIWAFEWNKKMHIWGNASNQRYLNLGVNNAVYAAAIKYAADHNLDYVDFGSTVPDTPHHFFKKRWGGQEKPIYVWGSSAYKQGSGSQEKIVKLLKILPAPILRPLCHFIYKYY